MAPTASEELPALPMRQPSVNSHTAPKVDHFWQTTPRTGPPSMDALVSAIQAAPAQPNYALPPAPTPMRQLSRPLRRPQCTHITMERRYGDASCSMCGREPFLGWLYVCSQDKLPAQLEPLPDIDAVPVVAPGEKDSINAKARVAEYLKMSPFVIRGIKADDYTADQIDSLIAQRTHVIKTIDKEETSSDAHLLQRYSTQISASSIIATAGTKTTSATNQGLDLPMSTAGTPVNTPCDSTASSPIRTGSKSAKKPSFPCSVQICQACRPFLQVRMCTSFEAVMNGEISPMTLEDVCDPPLIDREIALTIGLRKPPTPLEESVQSLPQLDTNPHQQETDSDDNISVDWTHTSASGSSSSAEQHLDSSELYPCPGAGQCPVWSRHSGCAYERGFDDGRRDINHGFFPAQYGDKIHASSSDSSLPYHSSSQDASSTASSISLPTPTASLSTLMAETEEHGDDYKRRISGGDVDSGVALTEEAVETGTADMITAK
ncbi:hypothetical protein DOTSEDRAFT_50694 [Dothistroma septosporum NZE10]|uniref:Uncharacterized protein n=1 Tax=Dothistroma septosporum (strain NZE10 / CBS 128990) TaxID=675120 RepID=N1PUT8_DOTSN|nr:hypothetical protein DOTSEDRAFT_50694 [Dothistroma septosporum NZE10]